QWSSPDTGILPLLKQKGLTGKVLVVSDDGVPFEMCDISKGLTDASQSQPANLYAEWALKYAVDAAKGVVLKPGDPGGGAPALQMLTYQGDANLGDPIVAPFVTKSAQTLTGHASGRAVGNGLHHLGQRRHAVGQRVRHPARRGMQRRGLGRVMAG